MSLALKESKAASICLRCSLVMKKSGEAMCRWAAIFFISLKKTREQARDFFALPLDRRSASE
jgi:hypothetical protein